jgi:hypothetical protein
LKRVVMHALCAMLLLAGGAAPAAVDEAALKAAIVYNLLHFIDWPGEAAPASGGLLTLCVESGTSLLPPLQALQGRPVRQARLALRELQPLDSPRRCHAVYAEAGGRLLATLRRQPGDASLLVISDEERKDNDGVCVHLALEAGRVVFDVDMALARRSGLQFSSRLLRLARKVTE